MITNRLKLPVEDSCIEGELTLPYGAKRIIIITYGNGDGLSNPQIRSIADRFHENALGTLIPRLITEAEVKSKQQPDTDLLSRRLIAITLWTYSHSSLRRFKPAYFGAGHGATAILNASIILKPLINAIVVHSTNPLLVGSKLARLTCPTLFVAGELNFRLLQQNKQALTLLTCPKQLAVISAASNYFEEPGKLEKLITISAAWFNRHIPIDQSR